MTGQWSWKAMSWTFAWEGPDSQLEPEELNAPANSNAPSQSSRSETHAEPEAESSTSAGTDMEIGVSDRRVRFREERDPSRDIMWTYLRTGR